ncbi:hypothetical protein RSO01_72960 [Reyranella soli]|uniref:Enterobactin synthase component D n=1 Tax=Reyranella soli TaxID=1230389 RepID=A0A512NMG2_9HYPH|nr:hypothetical protein RSO01_72960 [Reyranella soli]
MHSSQNSPEQMLTSMLGPGIAVEVAAPTVVENQLFPDEQQHIVRAVAKRQAEFGTARVCARRALARIGMAPCSLVPHQDRSPRWPPGVRGSISHTQGCCAVALTRSPDVTGLGIDIEEDTPLQRELVPAICTPEEQQWIGRFGEDARGWLGKLLFSAKEAFYKCQYPVTRTVIDFHDVQLSVDLAAGEFSVAKVRPNGSSWDHVRHVAGKFRRGSRFIVTTAVLAATSKP